MHEIVTFELYFRVLNPQLPQVTTFRHFEGSFSPDDDDDDDYRNVALEITRASLSFLLFLIFFASPIPSGKIAVREQLFFFFPLSFVFFFFLLSE